MADQLLDIVALGSTALAIALVLYFLARSNLWTVLKRIFWGPP